MWNWLKSWVNPSTPAIPPSDEVKGRAPSTDALEVGPSVHARYAFAPCGDAPPRRAQSAPGTQAPRTMDGTWLLGEAAGPRAILEPDRTVRSFKRWLGAAEVERLVREAEQEQWWRGWKPTGDRP